MQKKFDRGKTAIRRSVHSRPIQLALDEGLIGRSSSVLDYGCGRGDDVRMLCRRRIGVLGWDPDLSLKGRKHHSLVYGPEWERKLVPHDVVNLGFVLNVIEDPKERAAVLRKAWKLTESAMLVAVRVTDVKVREMMAKLRWKRHGDGVITSTGTFQKFYTQSEFQQFLEDTLHRKVIMAAPGVAYVFRRRSVEKLYLSLRYPRPAHEGPKTAPKRRGKE